MWSSSREVTAPLPRQNSERRVHSVAQHSLRRRFANGAKRWEIQTLFVLLISCVCTAKALGAQQAHIVRFARTSDRADAHAVMFAPTFYKQERPKRHVRWRWIVVGASIGVVTGAIVGSQLDIVGCDASTSRCNLASKQRGVTVGVASAAAVAGALVGGLASILRSD